MEYKHSNKPSQETLFGWYPGGNDSAVRENPKDVYINLGVRPPREQSYTEADLMYKYHQSVKPSERANCFSVQQTPDEAVRPPWALNLAAPSNQEYQDEIERQLEQRNEAIKNQNRTKSAPAIPTHRIILKIPHAQLNNLFDADGELVNNNNNGENTIPNQNNNNNNNNNFSSSNANTESNASFQQLASSNFQLNGSAIADISGNALLVQGNASNFQSSNHLLRPKTVTTQQRLNSATSRETRDGSRPNSSKNDSSSLTLWAKSSTVTLHYASHCSPNEMPYQHRESPVINADSKPPLPNDGEKKMEFLRSKTSSQESRQTTPKPTYRCKVIEVENFGESTVKLLENLEPASFNHTKRIKSQRCKTASTQKKSNDNRSLLRAQTGQNQQRSKSIDPNGTNQGNHYTMADYHKELQLASPDKKPITQTSSQIELANRYANYKSESDLLVGELNREEIKLAEGHWKDQLLGREKFLQKRPKYHVKIDQEKVRPDPPAPEIHYNAPETYFYNTVPNRKATFTINPNFRSEMLNVQKIGLQTRVKGKSTSNVFSHYGAPVRYRRNYAFCY